MAYNVREVSCLVSLSLFAASCGMILDKTSQQNIGSRIILDDKNHSYKKIIGQTSLVVPNLSNEMKFTTKPMVNAYVS